MLQHDDAVGSGGDRCAGHDFPGFALGQRADRDFTGVRGARDGERDARGGLSGAARVSVAGGAGERRLIIVSGNGSAEDTAGGIGEGDALDGRMVSANSLSVGGYEDGGFFVAGEVGAHLGNCSGCRRLGQQTWFPIHDAMKPRHEPVTLTSRMGRTSAVPWAARRSRRPASPRSAAVASNPSDV